MSEINEKITDLQISQAQTCSAVESLDARISDYIDVDEKRYQNLIMSQTEAAKNLADAAATLKIVCFDNNKVKEDIPRVKERVASVESAQKVHSWFIRGIVALAIISAVSGLLGAVLPSCHNVETDLANQNSVIGQIEVPHEKAH